jgi:hypothetical protein
MRTRLLHNVPTVLAIASSVWCSPLLGQWRVGLEVGAARFWGASLDTGGDDTSFRPYRPTTFGAGLERQAGRYAVGLQVHYAEAALALVGPEVTISSGGAFTIVSIWPEIAVRLASLGSGNEVRVHAGPLIEVWDIIDQDARTRVGAQGAVSLDVPLWERFGLVLGAGIAVTPSPFNEGELNVGGGAPTYDRRTLWRRSFAVGLRYRL